MSNEQQQVVIVPASLYSQTLADSSRWEQAYGRSANMDKYSIMLADSTRRLLGSPSVKVDTEDVARLNELLATLPRRAH